MTNEEKQLKDLADAKAAALSQQMTPEQLKAQADQEQFAQDMAALNKKIERVQNLELSIIDRVSVNVGKKLEAYKAAVRDLEATAKEILSDQNALVNHIVGAVQKQVAVSNGIVEKQRHKDACYRIAYWCMGLFIVGCVFIGIYWKLCHAL